MSAPDDPRFEWIHVPEFGNEDQWIRGQCHHLAPIPVRAHPTGELVAHLCPDCDAQLSSEWTAARHPIPQSTEAWLASSPHLPRMELGRPGPIARPSPFLLEPGERVLRPRWWGNRAPGSE